MNDFVFQNKTKIYFGKDQLTHLGEEAAAFGKKSSSSMAADPLNASAFTIRSSMF